MKALIGVMKEELIRKRMLAIVSGKYTPHDGEPKVWFTSMIALAQILSHENVELLRMMDEQKPESITELAEISGRKVSNLSSTLKTMSGHGFVRLEKVGRSVKPVALFTDFEIKLEQDIADRVNLACSSLVKDKAA
ncbi:MULTISPECIES: HVO_A0114 family putative DNA-binding protein [Providencia]|uniref:HVO_A0114 family putative DNA-binding protein n=1 Tax=Providencia TaxID=586 RepID=UPI001A2CDCC9|nr:MULTISPECIES: MarR family transcriptional regulator [Providencia]WIJ75452.1 MarR family transcriptional regulator [Providencia thailandensis]HAU5776547.1 MarR family transcriptional regulator [Providencia stuartii]